MGTFPAVAGDKVIIFHAGSLTVPLAKIEKQFETANPGIDIQREGGGSTKMARMISQLNKPADIMASADFKVIDKALIPKSVEHVRLFTTPPEGQPPNLLGGFISRISNQGVYSDVAVDVSNLQFQSILTTSKLHTIDHIIGHRVFLSVAPKNIHFI